MASAREIVNQARLRYWTYGEQETVARALIAAEEGLERLRKALRQIVAIDPYDADQFALGGIARAALNRGEGAE